MDEEGRIGAENNKKVSIKQKKSAQRGFVDDHINARGGKKFSSDKNSLQKIYQELIHIQALRPLQTLELHCGPQGGRRDGDRSALSAGISGGSRGGLRRRGGGAGVGWEAGRVGGRWGGSRVVL